ncbi:uncharacterized protein LOC114184438 [Vigna unguiculata]|uniref:uncharacterized protein LOC114184438 n=1 Tax=Vigna unguiculata TaxID=3917 RepID=UPI0010161688|nr:uncharacterized protein LOC114184438 [Vigna unguiculata]
MCPTDNRLAFTVYMLSGEAEHWWISMKSIMEERGEPVTWEAFRGRFLSEYLLDSVKYAKEVEFLQLTQGGKSVADYADKFKHLSRFYTLPLDEEWRCRKFENGLMGDIRLMPQRIGGPSGSKPKHDERRRPYDRPHHQPQGPRGLFPQQGRVQCYICGAARPPVQASHQHQRRDRGNRPQATGRVYAMTGAEAAGSGNLVMGRCMITGESLCVLFDYGVTHSFVSITCVERLGLPVRELQCEIAVSTPASGLVRMSSLCARLLVEVEGRKYKVLRLPPSREVEFSIDLVLGTGPVSMAPYRMAPAKLVELKKQIEKLMEK